uniref:Protein TIFY n=1 Tax=Kalanchoe fedtschenkoi TaxID=63787 RepID=A0A7N0VAC1_KALFE
MSSSSEFSAAASGNKMTSPEKSSFSKTCNLLREYLKEKGSLGDVNLGIALAGDSGFGTSSATAPKSGTLPRTLSSFTLFPQGGAKAGIEDAAKVGDYRCAETEPEKGQMTIFYGGRVMVFNDMPNSKAMEVMRLASIAVSQATAAPAPAPAPAAAGLGIITPHESITKISQPVLREIPIARKQSLARFLEKRKDRIMAHSPYSTSGGNLTKGAGPPSMPTDKSWLALAGS